MTTFGILASGLLLITIGIVVGFALCAVLSVNREERR